MSIWSMRRPARHWSRIPGSPALLRPDRGCWVPSSTRRSWTSRSTGSLRPLRVSTAFGSCANSRGILSDAPFAAFRPITAGTPRANSYLTVEPAGHFWPIRSEATASKANPSAASRGTGNQSYGQAEIRAQQAALQCGDHWSRGPWQDDVDGGADEGVGEQGLDVELRAV